MEDYLAHFVIGLAGALAGAYAAQFCRHLNHKIMVGLSLIFVETMITVPLVG